MPEGLVDWSMAERVAGALAGSGPHWDGTEEELRAESDRAAVLVRRYTGLKPKGEVPSAELVDRNEWARVNLEAFRELSTRVEEHLESRMDSTRGSSAGEAEEGGSRGGSRGLQRTIVRAATGAEIGLALGYLSQRVIGQYDVALIGPARAPRLLFVGPNLSSARARLDVDRDLFLRWIALHETTHAVHFASVPWLREHIGAIAEELFEKAAVEVKPGELLGKLARTNPRELVRSATNGELATLLWPEPQRLLVEKLTATMTLVEGYAEHVMDAVGDQLDPGYNDLRRALDKDRERRGLLDSIVSKVLGLEMKLAQYRRGKAFADEVVRAHGIRTLNRAWSGPDALPRPDELDSPLEWVERVGAARERRLFALFR
ncbi:MAG: zinc-dependent metalloprotease [Solirubrobacterales bacterium]